MFLGLYISEGNMATVQLKGKKTKQLTHKNMLLWSRTVALVKDYGAPGKKTDMTELPT